MYREFLPAVNARRVELLDLPKLVAQLVGLERRVGRGGRDSIDHAPGAHDDVANSGGGGGGGGAGQGAVGAVDPDGAIARDMTDHVERLRAGARLDWPAEVQLLVWTLSEEELDRLGDLLRAWPPERGWPPPRSAVRAVP